MLSLRYLHALVLIPCAAAQTYEIGVAGAFVKMTKSPLGSLVTTDNADDDTRFRNGSGAIVRATLNTRGYYGHELSFGLSQPKLETRIPQDDAAPINRSDKVTVQNVGYNFLMYMMPNGEKWRPYITGGANLYRFGAPNFPEWDRGSPRSFGANWGGGIKFFLQKNVAIRLDVRQNFHGKPYDLQFKEVTNTVGIPRSGAGGTVSQIEASFGVSFAFGGGK